MSEAVVRTFKHPTISLNRQIVQIPEIKRAVFQKPMKIDFQMIASVWLLEARPASLAHKVV